MARRDNATVPTFDQLMNPLISALRALGGSGTIDEIPSKVVEILNLPESVAQVPHAGRSGGRTELEYRLAWARTYLKAYGALENSARGVWAIAPGFRDAEVDPKDVVRAFKETHREAKTEREEESDEPTQAEDPDAWREQLRSVLVSLDPAAFERLAQRLLRESGFIQVEVTGRSGDGGIDGKGIASINGILSFHVMFQCKRYQGGVSAGAIRDFRGAMQGRADKGLFITTGTFTRDAVREATRDGAPPIDLMDGEQLCGKLRELQLGIRTKVIEVHEVDGEWFGRI